MSLLIILVAFIIPCSFVAIHEEAQLQCTSNSMEMYTTTFQDMLVDCLSYKISFGLYFV